MQHAPIVVPAYSVRLFQSGERSDFFTQCKQSLNSINNWRTISRQTDDTEFTITIRPAQLKRFKSVGIHCSSSVTSHRGSAITSSSSLGQLPNFHLHRKFFSSLQNSARDVHGLPHYFRHILHPQWSRDWAHNLLEFLEKCREMTDTFLLIQWFQWPNLFPLKHDVAKLHMS